MEYMMIVGFVAVITIPMLLVYYSYSSSTEEQIIANQADQIVKKVVDAAESVYYLGEPSQTTIRVYIPNMIINSTVANREVFFRIKTNSGISDIVGVTSVEIEGSLPVSRGIYIVTIKAVGDKVQISYK